MTTTTTPTVLFGSGEIGRRALAYLRNVSGRSPLCFVDSNPTRQGLEIEGVPVLSPDEALAKYRSAVWVATVLSLPASIEVPEWIRSHNLKWQPLGDVLPDSREDAPYRFGAHFGRKPNSRGVATAHDILFDLESVDELQRQQSFYEYPNYGVPQNPRPLSEIYFPSFIRKIDNEHFVDCGAADGDSIEQFLAFCEGRYARITAVEPDPTNFAKLPRLPRMAAIHAAVSDVRGEMKFAAHGDYTSRLGNDGDITVPVLTIDSIAAQHAPTFIKMDIEGSEPQALWGARQTLRDHAPVLAICCYHDTDHFWEIPILIHLLQPNYRLFLRRYASVPFELICYAVPEGRLQLQ